VLLANLDELATVLADLAVGPSVGRPASSADAVTRLKQHDIGNVGELVCATESRESSTNNDNDWPLGRHVPHASPIDHLWGNSSVS
jgi:hypothetical protein